MIGVTGNKVASDLRSWVVFGNQGFEIAYKTFDFVKSEFCRKKGLRVLVSIRRTPLTGRAETL